MSSADSPSDLAAVGPGARVGLVGCGRWGRHILRDLKRLGCHVTVVARSEQTRERATETGADRIVRNLDELHEVQGVVVCTPATTHYDVVIDALRHDVPIFVEKPMTVSTETARELESTAGGQLFVMDKWRYHPGIEKLAQIARSGELGSVTGLRTTRGGWGHIYTDIDTIWRHTPHDIAIWYEIVGSIPEPAYAAAETMGGQVTGIVGLLGDSPWLKIDNSASDYAKKREIRMFCEQGTGWLADPYDDHVKIARHESIGDEPLRRPISTQLPLLRELAAFVSHLQGGEPPRSSAAEGAGVVECIERLRELAGVSNELPRGHRATSRPPVTGPAS